jgi:ribosomal protein L29
MLTGHSAVPISSLAATYLKSFHWMQTEELRREAQQLHHELLREKTKVSALSEELENPMNVHRWRKLEGSDPAMYEMIQKIQTLQRRLISKTEEVVEKDLMIQEKDKLYGEIKAVLARQPGPEVAEQLSVYQASLKDKMRQMKSMAAELNMFQAKVNEHQYESERLARELQDMKRKHFESKRRQQLMEDMKKGGKSSDGAEMLRNAQIRAHDEHTKKFAGGGFLVK